MAYTQEMVRQMIERQFGGAESLAASVGMAEGGSRESQHVSAIEFWQLALELPAEVVFNRGFAQSEIARHQVEIAKLHPPVSSRVHVVAV